MTTGVKKLIQEVLEKGYLMSLATLDDGGVWVADIIYIHDDNMNIYWMSDPDTRHSQALMKNKKIAGTITVSGKGEENLGIQFEGIAEKIDGPRFDLAQKHFGKRNKPEPQEMQDVLKGDSWYTLQPSQIELICEKHFGFDKKVLEL